MENVIGKNMKRLRTARGLTQEQLGARAGGRSVNQMNGYERGRSRPSLPVLKDIAEALGTSVDELERVDHVTSTDTVRDLLSKFKIEVAKRLGLDPESVRIQIELQ
ncbi:MAG: helix-turn-helix transcriptional regulator [Parasphingopyxis sp.]|uniref:helix-turn-helix domain-containing protein n=1 Tax=Parasphingopyxis sp. TaxID=1920299 RepID=UPI0032EA94E1